VSVQKSGKSVLECSIVNTVNIFTDMYDFLYFSVVIFLYITLVSTFFIILLF